MGQEVYSQKVCSNNIDINLSSYDSGIYFLNIIQGNKRMTSKLIITKWSTTANELATATKQAFVRLFKGSSLGRLQSSVIDNAQTQHS